MKSRSAADLPDLAGAAEHSCACPRCNGALTRVPRRFGARLISLFVPLRRYRCGAVECGWEGNLRVRRRSLLVRGPP